MKKYFSSAVCANGILSAYNTIYKKDASSSVYIVNGGDDFERATFFSRLINNLSGYNITLFNPFYDESVDGIYIENINTYVFSIPEYGNFSPLIPGIFEKSVFTVQEKNIPKDLIAELIAEKSQEKNHYKNSCRELKKAAIVKERIHSELSQYLNEDKITSYIHRFCRREFKNHVKNGIGEIRLLSSPTPLGIHTHYDTLFHACDRVINIVDDTGFASSVILGVIKNCALRQREGVIVSPMYFGTDFWEFLIFTDLKLGLCVSQADNPLPFKAEENVSVSRFFRNDKILNSEKIKILLSVENKFLDKAVLSLYEGRDLRFKYNKLLSAYSDGDEAKMNADFFADRLLR